MGIMNPTAQFLKEQSAEGEFERQEDAFRELVTLDGSSPYPFASSTATNGLMQFVDPGATDVPARYRAR